MIKDVHLYKSFFPVGRTLNRCFDCTYCRAKGNKLDVSVLPSSINPMFRALPVAVNLFYGDPLLQVDDTIRWLDRLEDDQHTGIVTIITKGDLSKLHLREYDLDLHIAVSTFGVDSPYEPQSMSQFKRNLDRLVYLRDRYNVTASIEFRPIIYNVNDSQEVIEHVFKLAEDHFLCIAFSGLQAPPNLINRFDNFPFNPYPGTKFGYKKYLSSEVENLFYDLAKYSSISVFKKTSCCLSYLRSVKDYNAHYYRRITNRCLECPNRGVCFSYYNNLYQEFPHLPFDYKIIYKSKHVCGLKKSGECEFPDQECSNISGYFIKPINIDYMTTSDVRVIKWLTGLTVDVSFNESPYLSDFWRV